MAESPYFQFYASDWLAGTRGLSAAEMGVYITLLAMMYEREAPIDMDHDRLARLCGATPAAFKKCLAALIEEGKIEDTDEGLFNKRARKEIQIREKKREVNSSNAHERWRKTKQKQRKSDATASNSQCETDAHQNQNQNQIDSANALSLRASDFDRFWALYPDKTGKQAAKKKFDAAIKAGVPIERIMAGLDRYLQTDRVRRGFVKAPTTWLNQGCWDDQPASGGNHAQGNPGGNLTRAEEAAERRVRSLFSAAQRVDGYD